MINNNLVVIYPSIPVTPNYTNIMCTTSNTDGQTITEEVPVTTGISVYYSNEVTNE